jgi:hypothetical protein
MTRTAAANAACLPADRRAFLGSSLALTTVIAAGTTASAVTSTDPSDSGLLDLGRQWSAMMQEWHQRTARGDDQSVDAFVARRGQLIDAVVSLPAHTHEGLAIKVRALAGTVCETSERELLFGPGDNGGLRGLAAELVRNGYDTEQLIGSLAADLLRLTRAGGA